MGTRRKGRPPLGSQAMSGAAPAASMTVILKRIKLHLAQFAHQDCSLMGDLSGAYMMKGPIIPIVLVVGILVLGATAVLFVLNPASKADAPDEPQPTAASQSDTPILSAEARVALSDFIQAQGFNCPSVTNGTPSGENQSGQVIRVRCDNDLNFKVTLRPQGPMMFAVAPWQ
jgi:hypothetical protein